MSNKIYNFEESLKHGEEGEERVIEFLLSSGRIQEVRDVRGERDYQSKDIDIIVLDKIGVEHSCEIKTDSYTSGNLFYETMSCIETGSLGCIEKTEAEYVLYYFENLGELYVLKTREFREFFYRGKVRFRRVTVKNKRAFGCGGYTTEGYLIPRSLIKTDFHAGVIVDVPTAQRRAS